MLVKDRLSICSEPSVEQINLNLIVSEIPLINSSWEDPNRTSLLRLIHTYKWIQRGSLYVWDQLLLCGWMKGMSFTPNSRPTRDQESRQRHRVFLSPEKTHRQNTVVRKSLGTPSQMTFYRFSKYKQVTSSYILYRELRELKHDIFLQILANRLYLFAKFNILEKTLNIKCAIFFAQATF